jgi:hypothetical protein
MSDLKSKFLNFSDGEKAAYIINNGRQITSRREGNYIANLFSVDDFLVEVKYDRESVRVQSIEIIEDDEVINQYIDSALYKKRE